MNFCFQQTEIPNNKNMHGMIYKRILATQKNMEQGAAVVFFFNLSKYRFFFSIDSSGDRDGKPMKKQLQLFFIAFLLDHLVQAYLDHVPWLS